MPGATLNGHPPVSPSASLPGEESLLTLALDLWAVMDRAGALEQVNGAVQRTLGWLPEEMVGRSWGEFTHPDDLATAQDAFARVKAGETLHHFRVRCLCRDGSCRWIAWNVRPLPRGLIVAVGRDVTASQRQALLLERSSAAARIGGWELDCLTGELYLTDQTYRILETSPEEYAPSLDTALAFYAPESRPVVAAAVSRGLEAGEPWDLELELITARGRRVAVRAIGEAERRDGRTTRLFGCLQDVTEQKRAREEQARLEARVQQAQKLDSLGVLAGGIAHDFNNLLTGILGHADLALMQLPPDAPARESLEQVVTGATRAAELTRQLLAYSGKGKFVVQPVRLSDVLREMGPLLQVSISKKVTLKYHLAENLPPVAADATQLRQVAMNLILNASEAIGDRSGLIAVSTGVMHCTREYLAGGLPDEERRPGEYVFLGVSDTGCGMTEDVRKRIFDPFFSTKFSGRGLGLAAVLGIVRGHKGVIKVQTEPGRGTTFRVLFPAQPRPAAASPAASASDDDWRTSGAALVVDDEEAVRRMAGVMLRRMGFTVLTAVDGREGLETFRRHADEVRLVLLDLTMPQLDGPAVFREIHALRPDVRVLLSSGFTRPEGADALVAEGLAGFIQKPYRYEDLMRAVRVALERQGSKEVS